MVDQCRESLPPPQAWPAVWLPNTKLQPSLPTPLAPSWLTLLRQASSPPILARPLRSLALPTASRTPRRPHPPSGGPAGRRLRWPWPIRQPPAAPAALPPAHRASQRVAFQPLAGEKPRRPGGEVTCPRSHRNRAVAGHRRGGSRLRGGESGPDGRDLRGPGRRPRGSFAAGIRAPESPPAPPRSGGPGPEAGAAGRGRRQGGRAGRRGGSAARAASSP